MSTLFARLSQDRSFRLLSPSHQFELLRGAVTLKHPARAAAMNEWSPATRDGLLLHLANTVRPERPVDTIEIWRVSGTAIANFVASLGTFRWIDVRLLEGEDFRRTQLCCDAPAVEQLADAWRAALIDRGWLPM